MRSPDGCAVVVIQANDIIYLTISFVHNNWQLTIDLVSFTHLSIRLHLCWRTLFMHRIVKLLFCGERISCRMLFVFKLCAEPFSVIIPFFFFLTFFRCFFLFSVRMYMHINVYFIRFALNENRISSERANITNGYANTFLIMKLVMNSVLMNFN